MVSSGFAFVCWAQVEPLMSHCSCFLRVSIDGSSEESSLKPREKLRTLRLLCCTWLESNSRSYWNVALGFSGLVGLWRSGEGKCGHTDTGRNWMCFVYPVFSWGTRSKSWYWLLTGVVLVLLPQVTMLTICVGVLYKMMKPRIYHRKFPTVTWLNMEISVSWQSLYAVFCSFVLVN